MKDQILIFFMQWDNTYMHAFILYLIYPIWQVKSVEKSVINLNLKFACMSNYYGYLLKKIRIKRLKS